MKKTLFLTCVLLALSASIAGAGLNLGWGPFCPSLASSGVDQSDPCDGSTGATYELIGSEKSGVALSLVNVEEVSLDLQEGAAVLSDYWHLEDQDQPGQTNPAGCRGTNAATGNIGSLVVTAASLSLPTSSPCIKFWGAPSGGINYLPGFGGANRARINMIWGKTTPSAMTATGQYYSFAAFIDTNHQDGIDATYPDPKYICQGCSDGVCIVYNQCVLRQPEGTAGGDITVSGADVRNFVTWQGGAGTTCPAATPTHRATWGQVKSLYR